MICHASSLPVVRTSKQVEDPDEDVDGVTIDTNGPKDEWEGEQCNDHNYVLINPVTCVCLCVYMCIHACV